LESADEGKVTAIPVHTLKVHAGMVV